MNQTIRPLPMRSDGRAAKALTLARRSIPTLMCPTSAPSPRPDTPYPTPYIFTI
jgi:hypothetical protein